MALDPAAVEDYLSRPVRPWPDWKKLHISECQQLIEARTGIPFRRAKGPKLYRHQMRTLTACVMMDHTLVFLGMRMGKTRIFMSYAEHMRRSGMWKGQACIIPPTPTVVNEAWMLQAPEYSDLEYRAVTTTKLEDFIRATESSADVLVIAWPSLIHMFGDKRPVKKRGWKEAQNKYVLDAEAMAAFGDHFTMGCIDELHFCSNPSTARFAIGKALLGGPDIKYSMGLTGTAFGRADPFGVWAQANIIDDRLFGNNYYFFQAAFGKKVKSFFARSGFETKFDKAKTKIFQKRLASASIAYKLSEVRRSDVRNDPVELQMKGEQLSEYTRVLDRAIERSKDKALTSAAVDNLYVRLRRISSGIVPFVDDDGNQQFVSLPNHAKERWMQEALEAGMFDSPGVMFHDYTETGKFITSWMKKKKIKHSWLYGGTKAGQRPVQDFMRGKAEWIVCNIAAGSVGIDLSRADYLVFYEGTPSSTHRAQAEARPLGPGRGNRPLHMIDLLASAVDRRVLKLAKDAMLMHDRVIHNADTLSKLLR